MMDEATIRWPNDDLEADRLLLGFFVKALESQGREFGPELSGALTAAKAYLAGEIELQDRFKLAAALWAADDLDSDLGKKEPLERRLAIMLVHEPVLTHPNWVENICWFRELMGIGNYDYFLIESVFEEYFSGHLK